MLNYIRVLPSKHTKHYYCPTSDIYIYMWCVHVRILQWDNDFHRFNWVHVGWEKSLEKFISNTSHATDWRNFWSSGSELGSYSGWLLCRSVSTCECNCSCTYVNCIINYFQSNSCVCHLTGYMYSLYILILQVLLSFLCYKLNHLL